MSGAESGPVATPTPSAALQQNAELSGRILLAEDSLESQRLYALFLKRAGAEVDVADNGRLALDSLLSANALGRGYDLLITDVEMPEMDGYALAQEVRRRSIALPIVAITGHSADDHRQKSRAAGCDDYAVKPVSGDSLVSLCRKWIGHHEPPNA